MTLKQYMEKRKLNQTLMADKIGISTAMISRILSGERKPGYALKMLIQAKTKGAIKLDSWK